MKELEFDIGDWVIVKATVSFGYDLPRQKSLTTERIMLRGVHRRIRKGRFIGVTYRNVGTRKDIYYGEPAIFTTKKRVLVCLVKEGMSNKPLECLLGDLKRIPPEDFPFCKRSQLIWSDEDRNHLREIMKDQPRDSKGRWTK